LPVAHPAKNAAIRERISAAYRQVRAVAMCVVTLANFVLRRAPAARLTKLAASIVVVKAKNASTRTSASAAQTVK
jgi:hypothetical protein